MCLMALDHMKIAVHDRYGKEIWPQLHFTQDKPSSSSTVDTETPKSASESLRDLSR